MLVPVLALVAGIVLGAGSVGVVWYVRRERARVNEEVEEVEADAALGVDEDEFGDGTRVEDGEVVELEPVNVRSSFVGLVQAWRRRAKERRLAEKGYIKWFRLDSQLQAPKWVKPTRRGSGVGELHTSEGPYFFSRDAMVTDARTGAWVAMHKVNDADPVNLQDTAYPGIPVDRVEELLNMIAEAEKPGFFENLDISGSTAFILITVVLFLVYAATQVM